MKKLTLTLLIVFASKFLFARIIANEFITEKQKQNIFQNEKGKSDNSTLLLCTATVTNTGYGEDCFGNSVSLTASCTETQATCSLAYSAAAACAYGKVQRGLAEILEPCSGPVE